MDRPHHIQPLAGPEEIAAWHDERGLVDYITCGTGSYFDFYPLMPTVLYEDKLGAPYAAALKQVVKNARVQCESHVRTAENAEAVLASGQADLVSIVRGQIADPELGNKARTGRAEQIRPCLSCNQMCWGRRYRDYWISCLVNPSAGREFAWAFSQTEHPRRLLVVGGEIGAPIEQPLFQRPTVLEHQYLVGITNHRIDVMADQDERPPTLGARIADAPAHPIHQQFHHRVAIGRIQIGARLVGEDDGRIVNQRAENAEALPLPA